MGALQTAEVVGDRFEILAFAGSGGMAGGLSRRDRRTGELVAVKVLRPGSRQLERFHREAQVLAQLRHPGIVRYIAHGSLRDDGLFLAMEWLEGTDLRLRLEEGPLAIDDCIRLAIQIAAALAAAHTRAVVHRDIKPSNIFLPGGAVAAAMVLDFGLARFDDDTSLSVTGELLGTPQYMAPERWQGGAAADPRGDVFALGAVLYECLHREALFRGTSPVGIVAAMIQASASPLTDRGFDLPPALVQLVHRMVARDPAGRPADGAAVLSDLLALEATSVEVARAHPFELSARARIESIVIVETAGRADDATMESLDSHEALATALRPMLTEVRAIVDSVAPAHSARVMSRPDGSLLVRIPAPRLAIDQAVRAVRCALALRQRLPRTPLAVVTCRGMPGDVSGLLVRDEDDPPIIVDQVTAGLLPGRFEVVGRPRGLAVLGERQDDESARLLLGRPAPFVGRERELANLVAAADECIDGGVARAVLVIAPAGVGKSRLRLELTAALQRRGHPLQVWLGRGDPMRSGSPLSLIGDVVRRVAGILTGDPTSVQLDKLGARVAHSVPETDRARVVGFLGELIGVQAPDAHNETLRIAREDPSSMADGIRSAWEDWVRAETAITPVLLVLEDLHWGDASSVKLAEALLNHEHPCLVLGLSRPEIRETFPALCSRQALQVLQLTNLSRRQSTAIVNKVLSDGIDAAQVEDIVNLADGHPLYLEELIRHRARGRHKGIPETVLAMVQDRLDEMEPDARRVLGAASVFGEVCWSAGIEALIGDSLGAAAIERWLGVLSEREVVERRSSAELRGEREWTFRHALVRDAAYATLSDADRVLGHRRAGEWMARAGEHNAAVLAEHFERGHDWAHAFSYLEHAIRDAIRAEAMEEAKRYFDHAFTLVPRLPDTDDWRRRRISLVLAQLPVVLTLLDFPGYYRILLEHEPLATEVGDPELLGTLHLRLGETLWAFGRFDEAIDRLERGKPLCESVGAHQEAGYACQAWMSSHMFRGDYETALSGYAELKRHMEVAPHAQWHTYGLGAVAMAHVALGRWRDAIEASNEALRIAEASRQPGVISFAGWVLCHAHTYGGDLDRAVAAAEMSARVALTLGDKTWAECTLAAALCRAGQPERTIAVLAEGLAFMRGAQFAAGEMYASALVEAYLALGQREAARDAALEMLRVATEHGMRLNVGVAHRLLAEIALLAGEDATEHLQQAREVLANIGAAHELAVCDVVAARAHVQAGRIPEARSSLEVGLGTLERLDSPWLPRDVADLKARLC